MPHTDESETLDNQVEETPTEEAPADNPLDFSAADALKTPEEQPKEETKTADEEDEETDPESVNKADDEDDSDDDDSDIPQLDSAIAEKLKGTDLEARWQQQWKGLQKRETQITRREEAISVLYQDPDQAKKELLDFTTRLAAHHNISREELLSVKASTQKEDEDWQSKGFHSPVEAELSEKQKALEAELKEIRQERQAAKEQADFERFVAEKAPRTIKVLAKEHAGWQVTPDQVKAALKELPHLKDNPVKAVEMVFSKEMAKHYASASRGNTKVADLPPKNVKGQFMAKKNPLEITAADILAMNQGS